METVYLETSIISYLTAKPSSQIVIAGHQLTTQDWWDNQAQSYQLVVSELVFQESSAGDASAAKRRLDILEPLATLAISPTAIELATMIIERGGVPRKAAEDALHISIATTNGIDYLLTWNCKHIANAVTRPVIEQICREQGYQPSVICTPEELMRT